MKLIKSFVEKPDKKRLVLLKQCTKCIFTYCCYYLPNSKECNLLLNPITIN